MNFKRAWQTTIGSFRTAPKNQPQYRYSHHDFRRDIDPTILPTPSKYGDPCDDEFRWITQPEVSLPHVDEQDLEEWP